MEFGRSFQKLGRKSPLVVAVKDANMDFDLVDQGEGRISKRFVRTWWTRRRVFSKAVQRERKSAMFVGRQTGSPQRRYAVTHLTHYRPWA